MQWHHLQHQFKVTFLEKGRTSLITHVSNRFLSKASPVSCVSTNPNNVRSSRQYGLFPKNYLRTNHRYASSIVRPPEMIAPGPPTDNIRTPTKIQLVVIHTQSSGKEDARFDGIITRCSERLPQALDGRKLVLLDHVIHVPGGGGKHGRSGRNAPRYSPADLRLYDPKNTIVLCVVDTARRNSVEIRHIFADAHKYLEGHIGVRIVCVMSQSLAPSSYEGILDKINYIAGGTTGATPDLSAKFPNVLIAGGCTLAPGKGAVKYCPSVAAVVASSSRQATHFPGSARLQQPSRTVTLSHDGVDRLVVAKNNCIDDLEDMMTERFRVWNLRAGENPPAVVFYRYGIVWDSRAAQPRDTALGGEFERKGIINEEMVAIKSAYNRVFGTKLGDFLYVLVQSNQYREPLLGLNIAVQPHTVLTPEEIDGTHTYRVFGDDDSRILPDKAALADLVSTALCLRTQ